MNCLTLRTQMEHGYFGSHRLIGARQWEVGAMLRFHSAKARHPLAEPTGREALIEAYRCVDCGVFIMYTKCKEQN